MIYPIVTALVLAIAYGVDMTIRYVRQREQAITIAATLQAARAIGEAQIGFLESQLKERVDQVRRLESELSAAERDLKELEDAPRLLSPDEGEIKDPPSVSAADRRTAAIRRSEREKDDVAVNLRDRHAQPVTQVGDPE